MLLEIDAGNSRLKWRASELKNGEVGPEWARGVVAGVAPAPALDELLVALDAAGVTGASRILVSSVRDDEFRQQCRQRLQRQLGQPVEYAVAQPQQAGLHSGYVQPERLGVDRWLAMLAAWRDAGTACCVIDCGTTITLDVVAGDGRHQGGFIVPGLRLMHEALAQRSPALALPPAAPAADPGVNTAEAIAHGAFNMALGFMRDQYRQLTGRYGELQWYFTGGDAPVLAAQLDWRLHLVPDLVLDGLRQSLL